MSVTCVAPSSALQRPSFRRGAGPAAGLFGEIDVDNFAGGGGVGMGFELATGKAFDIAINHDEAAIAMHRVNHPHTRHLCESVWAVNPLELASGRPVRLAWFSPDCKHFSRAKGAKPVEKKIRGLAWVAVRWAKRVRPRLIMLENVREFMDWGPLTDEMRPCPARKGLTFKKFVGTLRGLGYEVEWKVLNAADYGAPTHRRRLFLIARSDGRAIVWPEKTHGPSECRENVAGKSGKGIVRNRDRLDLDVARDDKHYDASGHRTHIKDRGQSRPAHSGGYFGTSGQEPYRTAAECIDWSIPCPSIFDRKRPLAEKTLRRIALGIIRYVLNNPRPFIVRCAHGDSAKGRMWGHKPIDIHEPLGTNTGSKDYALVSPTLVQTGYSERAGQTPRALDIEKPLGTVVAGGAKHALVSALIAKHYGGMVGHEPERPLGTVTAVDHHSVVSATLIGTGGAEYSAKPRAVDATKGAVLPNDRSAVVSATLVGVGGRAGQSPPCGIDEPLRTTTAKADRAVVAATLTHFRGSNNGNGGDVQQPAPTQTAENRPGLVLALLAKYYGNDEHGQAVDDPMHTLTAKHRHGLVTVTLENGVEGVVVKVPASRGVEGGEYIIADIGLRMLTPRELARCQGFPDSYVLTGTQSNQVARIGNSVPPQVVEALIRANLPEACGGAA